MLHYKKLVYLFGVAVCRRPCALSWQLAACNNLLLLLILSVIFITSIWLISQHICWWLLNVWWAAIKFQNCSVVREQKTAVSKEMHPLVTEQLHLVIYYVSSFFSRAFLQVVTHLVSEWQRCRRWQSPLSWPHQGTGYHWSSWTDTCKANQTLSFATFSADTQLLLLHLFAITTSSSSSYSLPLHNS